MKKLAALLPLVALLGCMYTARPIKEVKGEVLKRAVFFGQYLGRDYSKEYITLFTVVQGSEVFHIGVPGVEGDSIRGCTVEKDSIKAIFYENSEVIHKKGDIKFVKPDIFEKTYDSPFTIH